MIKINPQFSVEKDKYQWLLHEYTDTVNAKDEPTVSTRTTYHPSLNYCLRQIANRMAGKCETVEDLKQTLADFQAHLDGMSLIHSEAS